MVTSPDAKAALEATHAAALASDPIQLYDQWLATATESELNDPNAAALATATPEGRPSLRMVLLKRTGDHRFAFYTNAGSQKGEQLAANPYAALCLHWKSLRRQIRVEGPTYPLGPEASDHYFHSRSRNSQIAAAISHQSQPLQSREQLEAEFQQFATAHSGEIPRPDHWQGFYLDPQRIEFWLDGRDRLHNRFLFTKTAASGDSESVWQKSRLYP